MKSRRFVLLASALVVLNIALWIVPQGLALQRVVVSTLFGKHMMRADVSENNGAEWRLARGIVLANAAGILKLEEADTKIESINVSSLTKVTTTTGTILRIKAIKPGWHVLVSWPAPNGVADSVLVEKRATLAAGTGSGS